MSSMTSSPATAKRTILFTLLVVATAALAWYAPRASAQALLQEAGSAASFFPRALDFGDTPVGGASAVQEIAFRNSGSGPMSLSSVAPVGGNFDLTHDCPLAPDSLGAGSYCTIKVRFAPAAAGAQAGIVQVIDADLAVTQQVLIQGQGVASGPKVAPSVSIVDFPVTALYTSSGPKVVIFTNDEGVDVWPYFLNYLPGEGEFSKFPYTSDNLIDGGSKSVSTPTGILKSCDDYIFNFVPMAPTDSCFALVYFTPYIVGQRLGSLELGYDYCGDGCGDTTVSVILRGNAVPFSDSDLSVSATTVDFGSVFVGATATREVMVTSTGYGPLSVFGVRTTSEVFMAETNCGRGVKTGSTCSVTVTCTPKDFATAESDLYIDHDALGGFTNVKLLCTGSSRPTPKIEVSATGVSFGNQSLGVTSGAQQVTIRSVGSAPLMISSVGSVIPFDVTSDCPASLAPGLACQAQVKFTPSAGGRQLSVLEVNSNDPDHSSVNVILVGIGCRPFSVQAARRGFGLCGP